MYKDYVNLIRPRQWVKNVFVFLPLFFSGNLLNLRCWEEALTAFAAFSLMASAVYCFNDVADSYTDSRHPRKNARPVASGRVAVGGALFAGGLLAVLSLGVLAFLLPRASGSAFVIAGAYLAMNIAYSFGLKRYGIVDVMVIATGFVLRVCLGGVVCGIWVSPWIVCLTFLLALLMAFGKRRDDVLISERSGQPARRNVAGYNVAYLNQVLGLLGSITMVCYIIYTLQPDVEARFGCEYVYVTSVFVLAGILRYLQLALVDENSGSPTEVLYKDRFVQMCLLLWVCSFIIIIYFI